MVKSDPDEGQAPVRILLVDDNPANLLALEAVLEPLGQEHVRASSGAEAIEKLHEQAFALVLMDVHMPALDGFQTVEAIRKRNELRHLPVMFLTALFKDEQSAARGYALGAVDFIMKPFEPEIIRSKVAAFVTLYQHNEKLQRQQHRIAHEVAARNAAELANRTKEEFVAVLGHDLRNPLNAILMTAQKLAESEPPEPCREACRRILKSGRRMERMIGDVVALAQSRLGSGIPIQRHPADLAELCRAAIDDLQITNPNSRISLHVDGDAHGEWDPDRVVRVVVNLVENAIKHSDASQEEIRVDLRGDNEAVVLAVHNFGDPIPQSLMPNLFEPFQRGEHQRQGLGLGLFIVKQIVRAHGAEITVESSRATGTTFTARWPRHMRETVATQNA